MDEMLNMLFYFKNVNVIPNTSYKSVQIIQSSHQYIASHFLSNPAQSRLSRLQLRVSSLRIFNEVQLSLVCPHEPVPEDVHGVGDAHPPHLSLS